MSRTIVLGYDGSTGADHALDKAAELAKLENARFVVVFAYEIPAAYGGETGDYRRAVRELAEEATTKPFHGSKRRTSITRSSSYPSGPPPASSPSPSRPARA